MAQIMCPFTWRKFPFFRLAKHLRGMIPANVAGAVFVR